MTDQLSLLDIFTGAPAPVTVAGAGGAPATVCDPAAGNSERTPRSPGMGESGRRFVPEWQREQRRLATYRTRKRKADVALDRYDYAGELARLDRSIVGWRLQLAREQTVDAASSVAGRGVRV